MQRRKFFRKKDFSEPPGELAADEAVCYIGKNAEICADTLQSEREESNNMKKTLSLLLVLVMVLSLCSVTAFAAENYTGKTVIL